MRAYRFLFVTLAALFLHLGPQHLGHTKPVFRQANVGVVEIAENDSKSASVKKADALLAQSLSAESKALRDNIASDSTIRKAKDLPVASEKPPVPIGGYEAIKKHLEYPALAGKAGMEAQVIVGVFIDAEGNPTKTKVRKGDSFSGFEKAVIRALTAVRWKPARQGDRTIGMWVWLPVYFKSGR